MNLNYVLGGLEPHFRVLFSAVFHVFPRGISIRVETCGSGRKQKCGLLWWLYIQIFYMYWLFSHLQISMIRKW
jgi:hypothetical protein